MADSASVEALAARLYAEMVDDYVDELTFAAVKSIKRTRQECSVCHTFCQAEHASASSSVKTPPQGPLGTPTLSAVSGHRAALNGGGAAGKTDVMLNCLNCSRPMASTRYAQHLSSCMGLGNSRRGAVRTSAQKLIQDMEASSPYMESDSGGEGGTKGKSKAASDVFKLNTKDKKRPSDAKPRPSPKKQKISPTKAAIPQHLAANPPQVKGTGPPRRQVFPPVPLKAGAQPPLSNTATSRPASASSSSNVLPSPLGSSPPFSALDGGASGTGPPMRPAVPLSRDLMYPGHSQSATDWIQKSAPVPPSPPHADADEIVDTDSSDDDG